MEIDISQFQIRRLEIKIVPYGSGSIKVMPIMYVPAVGDGYTHVHGQEIDLSWNEPIPNETWENWNKKEKAEFMVKMTMKLLEHEVREQLGVDGERILYPHPGPVPPLLVQYKPTRAEMQSPRQSAYLDFSYVDNFYDFKYTDLFKFKPAGLPPAPSTLPPAKPVKPPRSRYKKPHGGFPNNNLVRSKSRQETRHTAGVR